MGLVKKALLEGGTIVIIKKRQNRVLCEGLGLSAGSLAAVALAGAVVGGRCLLAACFLAFSTQGYRFPFFLFLESSFLATLMAVN